MLLITAHSVCAGAPGGPCTPIGPCGPVSPLGPAGPRAPIAPGAPLRLVRASGAKSAARSEPFRTFQDVIAPKRNSECPTERDRNSRAPTLLRGSAYAAYPVAPSATNNASVATTFAYDSRVRSRVSMPSSSRNHDNVGDPGRALRVRIAGLGRRHHSERVLGVRGRVGEAIPIRTDRHAGQTADVQPARTGRSAPSLISVSLSSEAGSESRTTPTPA
jgi:hypothetical protein